MSQRQGCNRSRVVSPCRAVQENGVTVDWVTVVFVFDDENGQQFQVAIDFNSQKRWNQDTAPRTTHASQSAFTPCLRKDTFLRNAMHPLRIQSINFTIIYACPPMQMCRRQTST